MEALELARYGGDLSSVPLDCVHPHTLRTPLHEAASYGHPVDVILRRAPDLLEARDVNGRTALHCAAREKRDVAALLQHVRRRDASGQRRPHRRRERCAGGEQAHWSCA